MILQYLARDIASRLHHRGVLICPQHSDVAADLRDISNAKMEDLKPFFVARTAEILSSYGMDCGPMEKPFAYSNGVAIIPIHGLLINRLSWSYSSATGYNFIRSQRLAALADPDVKLIVYDINSPGGVASGCAELSDEMYESRDEKPSLAVVDARCYSAAYFLASACDRVVVTPSGGVGSIGCFSMHVDYSKMLSDEGLAITFIEAPEGGEKIDGNPYMPLSARALAAIQRDVDYHYGLFVSAVARNRDLSEDDVRATKAGCFLPPEAIENGLIDSIETPAQAVANFYNEITSDSDAGDDEMTTAADKNGGGTGSTVPVASVAPAAPALTQADVEAAAGRAVTAALSAERTRQSGIRTCEEAKGRETLAAHLADNTEMTVDAAKAILAASPKVEPDNGGGTSNGDASPFDTAMQRTGNSGVRPDAPGDVAGAAGDTPEVKAAGLIGAYERATGAKIIDITPKREAA